MTLGNIISSYSSGAILDTGSALCSRRQFCINSAWWSDAHSTIISHSAARKLALQNAYRLDSYLRLLARIHRMEMRRVVIVEIHSDHDPKNRLTPGISLFAAEPVQQQIPPGVLVCFCLRLDVDP